jgi:choline dehydrogenase-like flavoprotein
VAGTTLTELLRAIGVEAVHDLPGIDEGLRDHYTMRVVRCVTRPTMSNERARRRLATEALALWRGPETLPGESYRDERTLFAHTRVRGSTVHHAVGTCRMDVDPPAEVDPDLVFAQPGAVTDWPCRVARMAR